MKKTIGIILAVLLSMAGIVIAGSINDVQYYDRDRNVIWNSDAIRTISDSMANIDADTCNGQTAEQISEAGHDGVGGGLSTGELSTYLLGIDSFFDIPGRKFADYLADNYYSKDQVNQREDLLQAQINLLHGNRELTQESIQREMGEIKKTREDNGDKYLCYFSSSDGCIKVW